MSWNFVFFFFNSLWLNFKLQADLWRSHCQELEIWAQGLVYLSWSLKFFFQSSDWNSNPKLFSEGLVAKSLKYEPKAWLKWTEILNFFLIQCDWTSNLMLFHQSLTIKSLKSKPNAWLKWAENLIVFFHSLCLNFKPQANLWRSCCQELEICLYGLKFLNSFFNYLIELQTSSCFVKVSLLRAWNLSSRLGSLELKIWFIFSFFVIELQTSSWFIKVSLPRAWNLSTRLGSHELKF